MIPVTFTYQGKMISGYLSKVLGSGNSSTYHLMVDDFYWGELWRTSSGWRFANQADDMQYLAEEFGRLVDQPPFPG